MQRVGDYDYDLRDKLGQGAFACVYKGSHRENPNVTLAIKVIEKKRVSRSQALLAKEIKILEELSNLKHDNVVRMFDCKECDRHFYLITEFCNGGDLAEYLREKHVLSEDMIARFVAQMAGAMEALHGLGIVHRDIKPHNLLLCYPTPENKPTDIVLKLADFGFARTLTDGVMAGTLCGSPMYMAPEVLMSLPYDAKADLWSIGTIVFQCLTGNAPFLANTPPMLKEYYQKNSHLSPKLPPRTSPLLKDLITRLLQKKLSDRIEFSAFFNHPFVTKYRRPRSSAPVVVPSTRTDSRTTNLGSIDRSACNSSLRAVSVSPLSTPALPTTASPASNHKEDNGYVMVPADCPRDHKAYMMDRAIGSQPRHPSASRQPSDTTTGSSPRPVPRQAKEPSSTASPARNKQTNKTESPRSRRSSESSSVVDIGSLTPPNITFAVGTPPSNLPFKGLTSRQRSHTDGSLRNMQQSPPTTKGASTDRPQSNVLHSSRSFSDRSSLFTGLMRRPSFAQDPLADKENLPGELDVNPPLSMPYAQSPPNMEGPILFSVPDLTDETLLNPEHRETVSKLRFVSTLVVSLIELAQGRASPLLDTPNMNKLSGCMVFVSEKQRRMEQLVLHIRALHVLTSSLQLAKQEVTSGRLQPSSAVKAVVKELNGFYHTCLEKCKLLKSKGVDVVGGGVGGVDQQFLNNTADKLIYEHAIELCQLAALDEIYGNSIECVKKYKNAHTLLHSLVQMSDLGRDRDLLDSYKKEVEKRLIYLERQGYCIAIS